jgi:putative SOS response-associated peptidase YedK
LRPHYNIAPTMNVERDREGSGGAAGAGVDALGPRAVLLEKEPEGGAGDLRRARANGRRKADVPRRLERRRCILPASGFFEGTDEADGKQPRLFTAADGSPILAFAGLWDRWLDPASKEEILSCTVIVSGGSAWTTPYHDRMPAPLRGPDFDPWLDGSLGAEALRPATERRAARMAGSPARE